jgi:hypothetical protein
VAQSGATGLEEGFLLHTDAWRGDCCLGKHERESKERELEALRPRCLLMKYGTKFCSLYDLDLIFYLILYK